MNKIAVLLLLLLTDRIAISEEFINVVTETWRPYNYEEEGLVKGTSTEIVRAVLNRAKVPYDINVYPWVRAYEMAKNNKNVLVYTIMRTPTREPLFKWLRPLGETDTISFYQSANRDDLEITTLEDAKEFKTVVVREDMKHKHLLAQGFQNNTHLYIVTEQKQSIKMLLSGRVDLMLFGEFNLTPELKSFGISKTKIKKVIPVFKTPPFMAFGKMTSDALVEKINNAYDELVDEGVIQIYKE